VRGAAAYANSAELGYTHAVLMNAETSSRLVDVTWRDNMVHMCTRGNSLHKTALQGTASPLHACIDYIFKLKCILQESNLLDSGKKGHKQLVRTQHDLLR
jgi:hypothetical protein